MLTKSDYLSFNYLYEDQAVVGDFHDRRRADTENLPEKPLDQIF